MDNIWAIRKSYGEYSSGTRVRMIMDANEVRSQSGINPGYSTVKVLCNGKVIDIEHDYLVKLRPRTN